MIYLGTNKFIREILEEHFEALQYLWARRLSILRSADETPSRLAELDQRIAAHTDGLVLAGEDALPIVKEGLSSEEPEVALAAALTYLYLRIDKADEDLLRAFLAAKGPTLFGIVRAFCYGPADRFRPHLEGAAQLGDVALAAAATEVLAFHGWLDPRKNRLDQFRHHETAEIRATAWRIATMCPEVVVTDYSSGWNDSDPIVRRSALEASAWRRHSALLQHCREAARQPTKEKFDELRMLAILGQPADLPMILKLAQTTEIGSQRFALLSAFGHPGVVETLLAAMTNKDPRTASAAGEAFMQLTAFDITSDKRITVGNDDGSEPDEFEMEFADEVALPDSKMATARWNEVKENFAKATRLRRGMDCSTSTPDDVLQLLDLESRWQACVSGRFYGTWTGSLQELERFPQPHIAQGR